MDTLFLASLLRSRVKNPDKQLAAAKTFLEVLQQFGIEKLGIPVIVFNIYKDSGKGNGFIKALSDIIESAPAAYPNVKVIDLSKHLNRNHFYTFDAHTNAEGHQVIARELLKAMGKY